MNNIFLQNDSWLESEAIDQINNVSKLEGMIDVVGLPDLHSGNGYPIGDAFLSKYIDPALIGSDIGCGILVEKVNLPFHKIKLNKWYKKLETLPNADIQDHINQDLNLGTDSLGTIGSGNHFLELQRVSQVYDDCCELNKNDVLLVIHSGSRGHGQRINNQFINLFNHNPLTETRDQNDYLEQHNQALEWARLNRQMIKEKVKQVLKIETEYLFDIHHNYVEALDDQFLHRKGAASTEHNDLIIVPGSRDDYSYLLNGLKNNALNSIAHGAGRKWKRGDCKGKLKNYHPESFKKTSFGGYVICNDKKLLYEEASQAYKNINQVIQDIEFFQLGQKVAQTIPFLTYKND